MEKEGNFNIAIRSGTLSKLIKLRDELNYKSHNETILYLLSLNDKNKNLKQMVNK